MILKNYETNKIKLGSNQHLLFYGKNEGLKDETIQNLIKNKKKIFGKGVRTNNRGYFGLISRFHEFLASKILGYNLKEINAQPKIFSKDVLKHFTNMPLKWTTLDTYVVYICLKNNIEIVEMGVVFNNRIYGESKWQNNFSNFIKHIFFNLVYLVQLRFQKNK